jgi:hypothetical protein
MEHHSVTLKFLVAACCALALSCAPGPRAIAPAAVPAEAGSAAGPMGPEEEIEQLWAQIEQDRMAATMAEPSPAMIEPLQPTPMAQVPSSEDPTCKPAKTERCSQSCTLSNSICKNAGRICELSQQLTGNFKAADKCKRAKATCTQAHETCCGCK